MPIHVTIDPNAEGRSSEQLGDALVLLAPTRIEVDCGGMGRVLLASLQARGLPAVALEKRPRPVLAEVQRIEELSREVDRLKHEAELRERDLIHLRDYQRDVRILIGRLE
jgi:hypothetical protein